MTKGPKARPVADRFWANVTRRLDSECWPWIKSLTAKGYGRINIRGKIERSHRVAFLLAGGTLTPEKPFVLHSCDNPPCCNPAHLRAGSSAENSSEMVKKNRHTSGMAKLTVERVDEIRALIGALPQAKIAALFGVDQAQVSRIINRKAWSRV